MRWSTVLRRSLMPLSSRLSTPAIGKTPQRMTADEAVSVIASRKMRSNCLFLCNNFRPLVKEDKWGYCSVGVNVDTSLAAIESAKKVIAIINPKVPRTHGNTLIHQSRIDSFVEVDREIYGNPEGMHITE
ncbi:hypothetical protein ANCDUO_11552, partial [Ancylostoma duodenale]